MGEHLTDLVEWMSALPVLWAYALILAIAYAENVIPPVPGDMIVVFGGYMVGIGQLDIVAVILLSTIGGAVGFMTMYAIGYRIGHVVLVPKRYLWLPEARIAHVREHLKKWGFGLVAANRFLSGLRSVISLTVGMAHMPIWKTTLYATLSALVWTTLLVVAGYFVGENWEVVKDYLRNYGWFITGLLVAFTAYHLARLRRRRMRVALEKEES